jgi:hypothetical protein
VDASSLQFDTLLLGARDWMLSAIILSVSVAAFAIWSYMARRQMSAWRLLAMLLKIAAVVALGFCLLEPMRRIERPRPGANVMALLVDNSRSMEIRPPGQSKPRSERLRASLRSTTAWQSRLAQDFDVRRYAFDDRVRAVEDLDKLAFDGNHSSLGDALDTLASRFASRPVAGVLLFSDGLATDDVEQLLQQEASFPVYPIVQGTESELRDIAVVDPTVTMSSFELAPAGVEANVRAVGMAGRRSP